MRIRTETPMSTIKPNRDHESNGATGRSGTALQPDSGSAWWAELLLGGVCLAAAGGLFLVDTSVGPFANVTVAYGTLLTGLYLLVAGSLGAAFVYSGLRASPRPVGRAERDEETAPDPTVVGPENDS
jgi:hypothetical protein